MSLEAPTPSARGIGFSEDANVIEVGVADVASFELEEDLLEHHDGRCFEVSTVTEGGGEKGVSECALSGLHVAQGQPETLAVWLDEIARHEMPSLAFLVIP